MSHEEGSESSNQREIGPELSAVPLVAKCGTNGEVLVKENATLRRSYTRAECSASSETVRGLHCR